MSSSEIKFKFYVIIMAYSLSNLQLEIQPFVNILYAIPLNLYCTADIK